MAMKNTVSQIRKAETRDAEALSVLMEQTFRDTFAAMNTPANMLIHCQASYNTAIQSREILDPGMETLLSEHDGQLVGFAQLGAAACPASTQAARPFEIQRLYVAMAWHGKGVAPALMREIIRSATRRGADLVWLGVWENNPRAIAFYEKHGFARAGAHVFRVGQDPQRDLLMTRLIDPA